MRVLRRLAPAVLAAAALLAGARPAAADTGIAAGYFFGSDGNSNAAFLGQLALEAVPGLPIRPQLSGMLIGGGGGRYAVTGEAEFAVGGGSAGLGAGVGKLNVNGNSGLIFDAFGSAPLVKHVSLDLRIYGAGGSNIGSGGYLGVSLHL